MAAILMLATLSASIGFLPGLPGGGAQDRSAVKQDRSPPAKRSLVKDEELIRAAPRDTFRVLDNPAMTSGATAEADGVVQPDEPVLGIELDGEARAYSLQRLGSSELVNDRVGKIPIAATW